MRTTYYVQRSNSSNYWNARERLTILPVGWNISAHHELLTSFRLALIGY